MYTLAINAIVISWAVISVLAAGGAICVAIWYLCGVGISIIELGENRKEKEEKIKDFLNLAVEEGSDTVTSKYGDPTYPQRDEPPQREETTANRKDKVKFGPIELPVCDPWDIKPYPSD